MIDVINKIILPIRRVKQHLIFGNRKTNLHNFMWGFFVFLFFFCKPVLQTTESDLYSLIRLKDIALILLLT